MVKEIGEFRQRMKMELRQKISNHFPANFELSQLQKDIVIDQLLNTTPISALATLELSERIYANALLHAVLHNSPNFHGMEAYSQKIAKTMFGKSLFNAFPSDWQFTDVQKGAMVARMLNNIDMQKSDKIPEPKKVMYREELETMLKDSDAAAIFPDVDAVLKRVFPELWETLLVNIHTFVTNTLLRKKTDRSLHDSNNLSPVQKAAVVGRILRMSTIPTICAPYEPYYADAIMFEANGGSLQCPICMEPLVTQTDEGKFDVSNMWFAPQRRTEHWTSHSCGHGCCRSCITQWAETSINDQKMNIKCPVAGCIYRLWDQDLQELVSADAFKRHRERASADYLKHLQESIKKDAQLKGWLKSNARPCPECHVIVSRYEGCDQMTCVCGAHFCYACGFTRCKCSDKSVTRPDIWNPRR
jgi:hypothetical protein